MYGLLVELCIPKTLGSITTTTTKKKKKNGDMGDYLTKTYEF
jgi:hypothetical protein